MSGIRVGKGCAPVGFVANARHRAGIRYFPDLDGSLVRISGQGQWLAFEEEFQGGGDHRKAVTILTMAAEVFHTLCLQIDLHDFCPGGGVKLRQHACIRYLDELLRSQGASARDAHVFAGHGGPYEGMFIASAIPRV